MQAGGISYGRIAPHRPFHPHAFVDMPALQNPSQTSEPRYARWGPSLAKCPARHFESERRNTEMQRKLDAARDHSAETLENIHFDNQHPAQLTTDAF
jgi:hypothetical protein